MIDLQAFTFAVNRNLFPSLAGVILPYGFGMAIISSTKATIEIVI